MLSSDSTLHGSLSSCPTFLTTLMAGASAVEVFCHAFRRSQRFVCRWQDLWTRECCAVYCNEWQLWRRTSTLVSPPFSLMLVVARVARARGGRRCSAQADPRRAGLLSVFEKFLRILFGVRRQGRANATAESLNLRCLCGLVHPLHVFHATSGAPLRWQGGRVDSNLLLRFFHFLCSCGVHFHLWIFWFCFGDFVF